MRPSWINGPRARADGQFRQAPHLSRGLQVSTSENSQVRMCGNTLFAVLFLSVAKHKHASHAHARDQICKIHAEQWSRTCAPTSWFPMSRHCKITCAFVALGR